MSEQGLGSIELESSMDSWDAFIDFITDGVETHLSDKSKAYNLRLAYEELISNIIRASSEGPHNERKPSLEVSMLSRTVDEQLWFVIRTSDSGKKFDPAFGKPRLVDTNQHVNDRPIGGLGLFLIEQSVDKATYQWVDGRNVNELWVKDDEAD
jgi:sigma-B regulation protein RsbU (phosphoserine phosphatase)